ncbi:MAG: UvrD-helicase domain-containing protein [Microbacteriaceae bacterium]
MSFPPTPEQAEIIRAAESGQHLTIVAGAGSGKTSTLLFLAAAYPQRRGLYLAFNKAIKLDAERKFAGTNVRASTMHGLAYRSHGAPFQERMRSSRRTMPWYEKADIIGIDDGIELPEVKGIRKHRKLGRQVLTGIVTEGLNWFLRTDVDRIDRFDVAGHLPDWVREEATENEIARIIATVHEYLRQAWADLSNPVDGQLPFQHDVYFKLWALSNPKLDYDVVFLDEAQDTDGVLLGVLKRQQGVQIIAVGDECQSIYGWRGTISGMDQFEGRRLTLTQSFRFGEDIAREANWWLDGLDAEIRVRGLHGKPSRVGQIDRPDAILTRSNAGSIAEIIEAQDDGRRVHIAGESKTRELRQVAEACYELQRDGKTRHRDFRQFDSWHQAVEFVEAGEAPELAPVIKLVDSVGAQRVIDAIDACVPQEHADVTVSTAHVAKGLEWDTVRIANDFFPPGVDSDTGEPNPISLETARLVYVAVTRARVALDIRGVLWARTWEGGFATGVPANGGGAAAEPDPEHADAAVPDLPSYQFAAPQAVPSSASAGPIVAQQPTGVPDPFTIATEQFDPDDLAKSDAVQSFERSLDGLMFSARLTTPSDDFGRIAAALRRAADSIEQRVLDRA